MGMATPYFLFLGVISFTVNLWNRHLDFTQRMALNMEYIDKVLSCQSCFVEFTFSAGEQEFFAAKQLTNEPKRCPSCRMTQKLERQGKDPTYKAELPCHDCGTITVVPFKPSKDKPVYCVPCYQLQLRIGQTES